MTLHNLPDHADFLGVGFTAEGLPTRNPTGSTDRVLKQLSYDRFTALDARMETIPTMDAPCLSAEIDLRSILDLVKQADRAILVTNFWYVRTVNPSDLTLTGMTRDGTFLIEEGHCVGGEELSVS